MKIDDKTNHLIDTLLDAGYECYVVGGAVRDFILKQEPTDFDLATNATPVEISAIFEEHHKLSYVGTNFKVSIVDGVEIATYRKDVYDTEYNACVPEFAKSIEEDLGRRDLTINSIAYDTIKKQFVDPFNGRKDLKNGFVRFTGDTEQRIKEDPLRIIRACRFIASINGRFHPETFKTLHSLALLFFDEIPKERIFIEITKVMKTKKASKFFTALHNIDILWKIFPEMNDCWDHPGGKHHNETVWDHMMVAGDEIDTKDPVVKLSAYLHDIGKPMAWKINCDGRFIMHEKIGARMAKERLIALKFPSEQHNRVYGLIKFHMHDLDGKMGMKGTRKLLHKFDEYGVSWINHVKLRVADNKGNLGRPDFTEEDIEKMQMKFATAKTQPHTIKHLAINGKDIINDCLLIPGPEIGKILHKLLEIVHNDPSLNTRRNLIDIVRERMI